MNRPKMHYTFRQQADNPAVHELYIYDDISAYGSWNWSTYEYEESETSAEYFRDQLSQIPDSDEIIVYINSYGGEVDQAVAISSLLRRHSGKVTAVVDGACHSCAFTILQAADYRVMNQGTSAIIHNMWVYIAGNATELRKAADNLDKMMDSCIALYMERAKISEEELRQMLDKETVLTPQAAMEYGFCDEVRAEFSDKEPGPQQLVNPAILARGEARTEPSEDVTTLLLKEVRELKQQLASMQQKPDEVVKKGNGFNAFFE